MTLPEIVAQLQPALETLPSVHAMWLEGSYATGKFREDSDIDVWLDVDDDKQEEVGSVFQKTLLEQGLLSKVEGPLHYSKSPQLVKYKFFLKDKTTDQRIELDLQQHSRQFTFSRADHTIKVLFDKDSTIRWKA